MRLVPRRRPWLRLLAGTFTAAAVVAAFGWVYEFRHLGWTDDAAAALVAREAQLSVAREARALEVLAAELAARVAERPDRPTDPGANRQIFEWFAESRRRAPTGSEISITLYGVEGIPIAWSGRPSDLPRARLASRCR